MATIAGRFLVRAKKANHWLVLGNEGSAGEGSRKQNGAPRDEGTAAGRSQRRRPRIDVKTDEWHRVRALPMYCSSTASVGTRQPDQAPDDSLWVERHRV